MIVPNVNITGRVEKKRVQEISLNFNKLYIIQDEDKHGRLDLS